MKIIKVSRKGQVSYLMDNAVNMINPVKSQLSSHGLKKRDFICTRT